MEIVLDHLATLLIAPATPVPLPFADRVLFMARMSAFESDQSRHAADAVYCDTLHSVMIQWKAFRKRSRNVDPILGGVKLFAGYSRYGNAARE